MFRFKRFAVAQDRTAMKVGTDGVLLGAWVALGGCEARMLDIGAGSGLIALMLAQRSELSGARIDAVEIDDASAEQANDNIEMSPWSDRVELVHSDIQSFMPKERYDLIISNPPYFVDSLHSPVASRSVARHTTELSFEDLIASAVRLLKPMGRFAVILPVAESKIFDDLACGHLTLVRRCVVYGREGVAPKRYMSEYISGEASCDVSVEELTIEGSSRGDYSEEYRRLTANFYLKF